MRIEQDTLRLTGAVTMETVPAIEALLDRGTVIRVIDFAPVTEFDSAAVGLLLACARRSDKNVIVVQGAPAGLQNLAKLYGVDSILGLT